ncbi:MAG: carboxypeptidase-like regulatory domain-containing protein [Polaribacter sp.]|nr:carboxypeptidase-like regulatory domain-containing protein [Polaribacter sp.]
MKTKQLLKFLFFFGCFTIKAQTISGKIMNKTTLKPIDKVAIVTDLNRGSTSDKNGNYIIQINNIKSATFSSLGYETLTLDLNELKRLEFTIYLNEKVNELDEIQLNLAKISLDSLLIKTQKSMQKNYISGATKNHFYTREKSEINFKKLELELEKSTLLNKKNKKLAEKELEEYASKLKNSYPEFSTEFNGIISSKKTYSEKLKKKLRINNTDSINGFTIMTNNENITIKSAQKRLQNIVLKHLDSTKTYKISSGLFKIEDSLSLKKIIKETDSLSNDNTFGINSVSYNFNEAHKNGLFFTKKNQYNFLNHKYYQHQLNTNEILDNKMYYAVSFAPNKSKSKFSGRILIDAQDYTVAKIEYSFADGKRGQNINLKWLLGLKVAENIKNVCVYYEKNMKNKVYLAYAKETLGSYAYVHRPIKFKENSKDNHKAKFDIKIEVDIKSTKEFLISKAYSIDDKKIKSLQKDDYAKRKEYLAKEVYNKTKWKNGELIQSYLKNK